MSKADGKATVMLIEFAGGFAKYDSKKLRSAIKAMDGGFQLAGSFPLHEPMYINLLMDVENHSEHPVLTQTQH